MIEHKRLSREIDDLLTTHDSASEVCKAIIDACHENLITCQDLERAIEWWRGKDTERNVL